MMCLLCCRQPSEHGHVLYSIMCRFLEATCAPGCLVFDTRAEHRDNTALSGRATAHQAIILPPLLVLAMDNSQKAS